MIKVKIECKECHKKIKVVLIPYGDKYGAICPSCDKIAYLGEKISKK